MADPICRWRNPYLETVVELIEILPKEEHSKERARELVNSLSPYDFYRTPYQLACQLGLYHETDGRYFPKFTYTPTHAEVLEYLSNWIIHYSVPNPYTRGFDNLEPFSIHSQLCRLLAESQNQVDWETTRDELFQQAIGNNDILINSLNRYSPVVSITAGMIHLKDDKSYDDLLPYIEVDVCEERDNKEYFFDLFRIPSQIEEDIQIHNTDIVTNLTAQDVEAINTVQNIPNLSQTEKNQIVAARIGQGLFRRNLIYEQGACPITGVDDSRLLIASHIKPWRVSNNTERLDAKNGLLLSPTYDKLFDSGFISFRDNRQIIISSLISDENKARLSLIADSVYPAIPIAGREVYLEYHRDTILKN
jgi:hypothetical protein